MFFQQCPIAGDKNLAYLVGDAEGGGLAAVDPGHEPERLKQLADQLGRPIEQIWVTHSHLDHLAGVDWLRQITGACAMGYHTIAGMDKGLSDRATWQIGDVAVEAIYCPGHRDDSMLFLCDGRKMIVGDELFIGGVGRTRSAEQAARHYQNLHQILLQFDDAIEVFPGHDYGAAPSSTIGEQRRTNPYLLQPDAEAFWELRQHWADYCQAHEIDWG